MVPGLREAVERQCQRYRQLHGKDLDFNNGWWTPPLSPGNAYSVEFNQISDLQLHSIVSLSDHDDINAPLELNALQIKVPVSVEWTVPLGESFIHLGIHNLPQPHAQSLHDSMQAYTAAPNPALLTELIEHLDSIPGVLIIFNHPLWDEPGLGDKPHREMVARFLDENGLFIHAFELNGLRNWDENRQVTQLAARYRKPLISGGDRHASEPNACINLTNANSFDEFANEIRDGNSFTFFRESYRTPTGARLTQSVVDIMSDHPNHQLGWVRWSDRVFFESADGSIQSLTDYWNGGRGPRVVRLFTFCTRLMNHRRIRPAVTFAFGAPQECLS